MIRTLLTITSWNQRNQSIEIYLMAIITSTARLKFGHTRFSAHFNKIGIIDNQFCSLVDMTL